MKILIAGGLGFIGTNLTKKLCKDNEVVVIDNLSTSCDKNLKLINQLSNVTFFRTSICYKEIIDELFNDYKFDEVYNLACPASPEWYQKFPLQTIQANTTGLINILDNSLKYNSKVIHTSTSEIYGDPLISPQKEDYFGNVNTLGPRSCYDEGKRLAETICYEYHKKGVDIRIARIFNTYGPWMRQEDGRVVSNFIVNSLKGSPLVIYGNGEQTRSFQYIDDLLNGFECLMNCDRLNSFGPYNLGNPDEKTLLELASKILKLTNSSSEIIHTNKLQDDPKQRRPDISKAKEFLNWQPKVELDTGLEYTINYFRNLI